MVLSKVVAQTPALSWKSVVQITLVIILYLAMAKVGSFASIVDGNVSSIWPASGLMVALVLIYGYRFSISAFIGTFIFVLSNGAPLIATVGVSLGNAIEPLLAAWLVNKFIGANNVLSTWKNTTTFFVLAGVVATSVCALIGVLSILSTSELPNSLFSSLYFNWWMGDVLGVFVLSPCLLVLLNKTKDSDGSLSSVASISIPVLTAALIIFFDVFELKEWRFEHLIFALVVWVTLQKDYIGAVYSVFPVSFIVILSAILGYGPFEILNSPNNLPPLQFYLIAISFTCFVIASTEYRRKVVLQESHQLNEELEDKVNEKTLKLNELVKELTTNKQNLELTNQELVTALKTKEILLKEVHHRVKNNLQFVSSLLQIQGSDINDIKAAKAIDNSKQQIHFIALVHQTLYSNDNPAESTPKGLKVAQLLSLINNMYLLNNNIKLITDIDDFELDFSQSITVGQIINELVQNTVKHAFEKSDKDCSVKVVLKNHSDQISLSIEDNGKGFSDDFTLNDLQTVGLKLVVMLAEQLDAKIQFSPNQPTGFQFKIPMNGSFDE